MWSKGDRIFCCHANATQESCLPRARFSTTHSGEVVTSLAIQSLSLSHLALTYGFISRLGIDPKTLKRLQITQGPREPNQIALESVNICSNHQDSNSILKCQDLVVSCNKIRFRLFLTIMVPKRQSPQMLCYFCVALQKHKNKHTQDIWTWQCYLC